MITVQVKGGIGNQLYQIAAVYSHALTHNLKFVLNYELEFGAMQGKHPKVYKDSFYKFFESVDFKFNIAVREPSFLYKPLPFLGIENDAVYEGYFQSWRYFQNLDQETLNKIFNFEDKIKDKVNKGLTKLKEKHGVDKIVGVHIRRGDYFRNPDIFNIVKKDYYDRAKEEVGKDSIFIYTTDDLPSVRKEFTFDDKNILSNGSSEMEDLCVLSQCDDIIMANSSFSAWGSYLGKEKGKIICPKKWFEYKGPPSEDLKDPKWVQL
tara:strand:+ start:6243 stop:7034 length:792 start_codon:yes stop_codon:yes gene_type:complete